MITLRASLLSMHLLRAAWTLDPLPSLRHLSGHSDGLLQR